MAIGAAFAVGSLSYERGTLLEMGPAYVPFAVGLMLAALGIVVAVKAFVAPDRTTHESSAEEAATQVAVAAEMLTDDTRPSAAQAAAATHTQAPLDFGRVQWRPVVLVLTAVLFFAYTLEGLGLLVTVFGTVILASFARELTTVRQALITAVSLTVACWLIFVVALQQRIPLVGGWLGG